MLHTPGPQDLSCKAVFQLVSPRPVQVPGVVHPQGFVVPFAELHETPLCPFLQPLEVPLTGTTTVNQHSHPLRFPSEFIPNYQSNLCTEKHKLLFLLLQNPKTLSIFLTSAVKNFSDLNRGDHQFRCCSQQQCSAELLGGYENPV